MKQYICDRCGAVISLYNHRRNHIVFYDRDIRSDIQYQNNYHYNECDLCDDCLEYLHNMNQMFMENYELFAKK